MPSSSPISARRGRGCRRRPRASPTHPGIFLGPDYHFDLARPGAALYGVAPVAGQPNPMPPGRPPSGAGHPGAGDRSRCGVGYGGTWRAPRLAASRRFPSATPMAFCAAWAIAPRPIRRHRSAGRRGRFHGHDHARRDRLARQGLQPGDLVDLIGEHNPVDAVAEAAGTIGYEILTSLGGRYFRTYLGG